MTFEEYRRQAHCGQWDFDSVLRSLYDEQQKTDKERILEILERACSKWEPGRNNSCVFKKDNKEFSWNCNSGCWCIVRGKSSVQLW